MVDDSALSSVLSGFARTLPEGLRTTSILDELARRLAAMLPRTSVGVSLLADSGQPAHTAASDDVALGLQDLSLEDGPCLLTLEAQEPVTVPDLATDERFPFFARAALAARVAAVHTFPLQHGGRQLGALALYRSEPGALTAQEVDAALTLAGVATAYLITARGHEETVLGSQHMRHLASHDALTGLPNRRLLLERLEHAGQRARRTHAAAGVLFVDLDRFKLVNDTYGHAVGDGLLAAVAARLSTLVRPGDTLARLYGDEFVLLFEDMRDRADADALADRVRGAFAEPFLVDGTELSVSASVGVAFAGPGEDVSGGLLARADGSMYEAKGSGREPRLRGRDATDGRRPGPVRGDVTADLTAALDAGELSLDYQPVVDHDGAVSGVEALVRWRRPEGPVPVAALLEHAERSGVIRRLEGWVLAESSRQVVRWRRLRPAAGLRLHVNVSPSHVTALGFMREVLLTLDRTGLPRDALVLEVTEAGLAEGGGRARTVLQRLRAAGVRIALDDFGTGVSSLTGLRRLPVDILKIERAAWAADTRTSGRPVLTALVGLAHACGLQAVVEGVESQADREATLAAGADLAQGFAYYRPAAAAAVDEVLSSPVRKAGGVLTPVVPVPGHSL